MYLTVTIPSLRTIVTPVEQVENSPRSRMRLTDLDRLICNRCGTLQTQDTKQNYCSTSQKTRKRKPYGEGTTWDCIHGLSGLFTVHFGSLDERLALDVLLTKPRWVVSLTCQYPRGSYCLKARMDKSRSRCSPTFSKDRVIESRN